MLILCKSAQNYLTDIGHDQKGLRHCVRYCGLHVRDIVLSTVVSMLEHLSKEWDVICQPCCRVHFIVW